MDSCTEGSDHVIDSCQECLYYNRQGKRFIGLCSMGVSWSLANSREEDLSQFGASCVQLEKLLRLAAEADKEVFCSAPFCCHECGVQC